MIDTIIDAQITEHVSQTDFLALKHQVQELNKFLLIQTECSIRADLDKLLKKHAHVNPDSIAQVVCNVFGLEYVKKEQDAKEDTTFVS